MRAHGIGEDRGQLHVLELRARSLAARAARSTALCIAVLASCQRWVRTIAMTGAAGSRPSTRRSRPLIAAAANATSGTVAPNSPTVSSDHEKHFIPTVGNSR
jgi:hypothetical protein